MVRVGFVFVVGAALLVAACGTGTEDEEGAGGSGGGGTPGSCEAICAKAIAANCGDYFGDEAACVTACNRQNDQLASGSADCQREYAEWKDCFSNATDLECTGQGVRSLSCRESYDHFNSYCTGQATPETACLDQDYWNQLCGGGTPNAMSCFGDVPDGCVLGGDASMVALYCCP